MKCSKCGIEKEKEKFVKNKECKDGVSKVCRDCQNIYSKKWKDNHREEYAERGRKRYYETEGKEVKEREEKRRKLFPLRVRCQILRSGMTDRAKLKNLPFDKNFFTVKYLMETLEKNPFCECCGKVLDLEFKKDRRFNDNSPSMDRVDSNKGYEIGNVAILCWRCNKHKQDSNKEELRLIADFIEKWENK
jgi:hypothetical protein